MPAKLHFLGGTEIRIEGAAAEVAVRLRAGWTDVDLQGGQKAYINAVNVLFVQDRPDPQPVVFEFD